MPATFDLDSLVKRVKARRGRRKGIATAADHLAAVAPCLDSDQCKQWMASIGKPDAWLKALDDGASKLVYSDDGMTVDGIMTAAGSSGDVKKIKGPTPGAVMDLEAVVTSSSKDREGDILEPGGATVDPKSPLLLYHIPFEPIGKLVAVTKQTKKIITTHLAILDNALGRDVAQMVDFGMLRISHGFRPQEFEPLDKDDDEDNWRIGFHITKYEMVEISLVTVPANVDAIITLTERGKATHPFSKAWADEVRKRLPQSARSGWDGGQTPMPYSVTINSSGLQITPAGAAAAKPADMVPAGKKCSAGHCECGEAGCQHRGTAPPPAAPPAAPPAKPPADAGKDGDGQQTNRPKISKRNLSKLKAAVELMTKAGDDAEVSRSVKALITSAVKEVEDVIKDGENVQADDEGKALAADDYAAGLVVAMERGAGISPVLGSMLQRRLDAQNAKALDAELAAILNS